MRVTIVFLLFLSIFLSACSAPASSPQTNSAQTDTQQAVEEVTNEPETVSMCFALSDSHKDDVIDAQDYFLWERSFEKCDDYITEQDVREYFLTLDYGYCHYPNVQIKTTFSDINQVKPNSIKYYLTSTKDSFFKKELDDTIEFDDYSDVLEDQGLSEKGIIKDNSHYITVASGINVETGSDEIKEKVFSNNGYFDVTLEYKSVSGQTYTRDLRLPFVDPRACDLDET